MWIPGHMNVEGNELADQEAHEGKKDTGENRNSVDFILKPALSAFRPMSKDAERAMGRMTFTQAARMLNKIPRGTRSQFPTAKSYRFRFKLSDSPLCSKCNEQVRSSKIIVEEEDIWIGLRLEMKYMISNKEALKSLYEFFKNQFSTHPRASGSFT
ncbi:hypothetical protein E3P81_00028 [Wallemia ichthyophaga]|nr:hypothetical protein E3P85_00028 [Wallemia ichthyophaga]TIB54711.1 hypothetical protein E3P81_00028 [Wallemia ichthyophaga]